MTTNYLLRESSRLYNLTKGTTTNLEDVEDAKIAVERVFEVENGDFYFLVYKFPNCLFHFSSTTQDWRLQYRNQFHFCDVYWNPDEALLTFSCTKDIEVLSITAKGIHLRTTTKSGKLLRVQYFSVLHRLLAVKEYGIITVHFLDEQLQISALHPTIKIPSSQQGGNLRVYGRYFYLQGRSFYKKPRNTLKLAAFISRARPSFIVLTISQRHSLLDFRFKQAYRLFSNWRRLSLKNVKNATNCSHTQLINCQNRSMALFSSSKLFNFSFAGISLPVQELAIDDKKWIVQFRGAKQPPADVSLNTFQFIENYDKKVRVLAFKLQDGTIGVELQTSNFKAILFRANIFCGSRNLQRELKFAIRLDQNLYLLFIGIEENELLPVVLDIAKEEAKTTKMIFESEGIVGVTYQAANRLVIVDQKHSVVLMNTDLELVLKWEKQSPLFGAVTTSQGPCIAYLKTPFDQQASLSFDSFALEDEVAILKGSVNLKDYPTNIKIYKILGISDHLLDFSWVIVASFVFDDELYQKTKKISHIIECFHFLGRKLNAINKIELNELLSIHLPTNSNPNVFKMDHVQSDIGNLLLVSVQTSPDGSIYLLFIHLETQKLVAFFDCGYSELRSFNINQTSDDFLLTVREILQNKWANVTYLVPKKLLIKK